EYKECNPEGFSYSRFCDELIHLKGFLKKALNITDIELTKLDLKFICIKKVVHYIPEYSLYKGVIP
ncbi:MAG: hypothetical protein PHH93_11280, partial [Prolixibacteraceae bacterium]|nr:hypothetical protein [Prolixibacteraceae bacterium]